MTKHIILLSSITYAYVAKDILYDNGIKCYIERVPINLRSNGCGYGVSIYENPDIAKKILENKGLKVRDILTI